MQYPITDKQRRYTNCTSCKQSKTVRRWHCNLITGIRFGGLGKPTPKPKPLIAPTPQEHKDQQLEVVKNPQPKQIDE